MGLGGDTTALAVPIEIPRWVVERTCAWVNQFRRLRVRYDNDSNGPGSALWRRRPPRPRVALLAPANHVQHGDCSDKECDTAEEDQQPGHDSAPPATSIAAQPTKNTHSPIPSRASCGENAPSPRNCPKTNAPSARFAVSGSLSANIVRCAVFNTSIVRPPPGIDASDMPSRNRPKYRRRPPEGWQFLPSPRATVASVSPYSPQLKNAAGSTYNPRVHSQGRWHSHLATDLAPTKSSR